MTRDLVVATPADTRVAPALLLMRKAPFRRLPVVDYDGVLPGPITLDDILKLVADELGKIKSLLELGVAVCLGIGDAIVSRRRSARLAGVMA